jgi:membrane protease YdiL (CAAX protease family)
MTEGVNKERVNGLEAPIENMVGTKCATKSVAWYDIVVILLFFMLSQALGGFVTAFLGVRLPGEAYTTSFDADVLEEAASMQARFVAITYAISMVICFALLWIYRLLRGWKGVLSLRTTGWLASFRLLCGYLLMWCVSIAVEPLAELLPGDQSSLGGGGWLLVSAVMLAPVFEEVIFRGYTAGILRRLYGGLAAWFASSLIFGLVHLIPSVVLSATFSGLVLGYYYLRYRSLMMVIILHAMNNITACFLRSIDLGETTIRELLGGGALYWSVFAFCVVVAVVSLIRMGKAVNGIKSDNYQLKM